MKIDDSFSDKVIIRQLVVEAILGILPTERVTPQPVHIDITYSPIRGALHKPRRY